MPGARSEDRKRSVLFSCLPLLLQSHAERIPHRPAILCVAGAWPPPLQVRVEAGGGTTVGNARLADDKINKPC